MTPTTKKASILAITIAIAGLAAYWHYSPHLAMKALRSAAESKNAQAFNDGVDYPRLRESIKSQMSDIMATQVGNSPSDQTGFAAMGAALAKALIDPMIDMMVSPSFMMAAMARGDLDIPSGKATPAPPQEKREVSWSIQREGLNRVVASPINDEQPNSQQPAVVFERNGFADWKLVELLLR